MKKKTCISCGTSKQTAQFHRDKSRSDGRDPRCKSCRQTQSASYRQANREQERQRGRDYYKRNREKVIKRTLKYRETHRKQFNTTRRRRYRRNLVSERAYFTRWQRQNPRNCLATLLKAHANATSPRERVLYAQHAVFNARKAGRLVHPDTCDRCGKQVHKICSHHENYDRALEVETLCEQCHAEAHRQPKRSDHGTNPLVQVSPVKSEDRCQ